MTSFKEARAFLLKHRTDYDAAVKGFRWPDPVAFNWALDWFDAELARDPHSTARRSGLAHRDLRRGRFVEKAGRRLCPGRRLQGRSG